MHEMLLEQAGIFLMEAGCVSVPLTVLHVLAVICVRFFS